MRTEFTYQSFPKIQVDPGKENTHVVIIHLFEKGCATFQVVTRDFIANADVKDATEAYKQHHQELVELFKQNVLGQVIASVSDHKGNYSIHLSDCV